MNGRELLEAMSFIEEELLQDNKKPAARRNHWLSLAACLCILVLGSLTFPYWGGRKAADTVMEETAAAMGSNEAFSEFADAAPRAECPPVTDLNTYGPLLTDLGIDLLRHSFRGEENVLISPLSVMNALAMTANGADTETLAQMEAVLGGENRILNDYIYNYQRLLRENADGTLHTANSIWFSNKPSLQIREEFLHTNTDYFGAEIFQTTFDENTAAQVNQWVSENTDGMIPQILEDVPSDAIMYLVNALAFDANWQTQYQDYQVKEGTFTTESGTVRDVDMMYATEHHYLETPQFTGFSKYYEGRRYAFVALLPKEGVSMEELLLSLSADTVHNALLYRRMSV